MTASVSSCLCLCCFSKPKSFDLEQLGELRKDRSAILPHIQKSVQNDVIMRNKMNDRNKRKNIDYMWSFQWFFDWTIDHRISSSGHNLEMYHRQISTHSGAVYNNNLNFWSYQMIMIIIQSWCKHCAMYQMTAVIWLWEIRWTPLIVSGVFMNVI